MCKCENAELFNGSFFFTRHSFFAKEGCSKPRYYYFAPVAMAHLYNKSLLSLPSFAHY